MSTSKKPKKRQKKRPPRQSRGSVAPNSARGASPFPSTPPLSMFSAEQALRELHETLQGHEFSSKEELDAFIEAFNQRSMNTPGKSKTRKNPKHEAQDLAYQAMETPDPVRSAKLCERAIELDPHCVDALMHLTRLSCEDGDEMIESMRMVVDIGERGLGGKTYFDENKGYFWGLMESG